MGMKPNQRVALTKQLIYSAFLELLQKKSIHQISIRELCEKAGINRTTFYRHYGSQYDILAEMTDNYLNAIANTLAHADVRDRESVHSRVALVLQYVRENEAISTLLMNNQIDATFAQRLFSLPKIEDMLDKSLADLKDEKEKAATIAFAIYGSYQVLQDWIHDPDRVPPEEEAELVLALAGSACGWKNLRDK